MNKLMILLLSGLAWGNLAQAADTLEYDFTGRVIETNCKTDLYYGSDENPSESISAAIYLQTLPAIGDIVWFRPPSGSIYHFRVTCPSGYAASEVTGKITTSQATVTVGAATVALKNQYDDISQIGIVLKDIDQNTMIDFSSVENTQTLTQKGESRVAEFKFDVGIVRYGETFAYSEIDSSIVFLATFQ